MVGVFMRHENRPDVGGADSAGSHAVLKLPRGKTGVKKQQSCRTVDDTGIALASASQHSDSEFSLNLHE